MTSYYYSKRFGRQLLIATVALLAATLLVVGLAPPQEAQSREQQQPHNKSGQQKSQEQSAPAENDDAQGQQQQQDDAQHQQQRVFDKDPKGKEVASGELLVSYKRGASKEAKEEAAKGAKGQVKKVFPEIETQLLSFDEVKNERAQEARQRALEQKKEALERNQNVEAVDYNHVVEPSFTPNDPDYGSQWAYPKIKAPQAWDTTQGTTGVRVAVIDTGIDASHPDLSGKIVAQYDFANDDSTAEETSDQFNGHGTHVAGTIAANTNNATGVAGTCPYCRLLIAKYWDETDEGTTDTVLSSIEWAVNNAANVINMSFGNSSPSTAKERAIDDAWDRGIVLVAGAGNDGTNGPEFYPAAYQNVIAVGATNEDDTRRSTSNAGDWVDVAAPGDAIYSTVPTDQGSYGNKSGTSMATPHVSGLAGLLISKGLTDNSAVRTRIESKAVDLGDPGRDPLFGAGRIDAEATVRSQTVTYQENSPAVSFSGGSTSWARVAHSGASGGYVKAAGAKGAWARLPFKGFSVSWLAAKGPNLGKASVYVDGFYAGTVDLYSSSPQMQQVVFTKSWRFHGNHTLEVRVQGTSGRPYVNVDAFRVLKP